jgi:hypothetical protein
MFAGVAGLRALVLGDPEEGRRARVFAVLLVAMGLATLVNPYGVRLHTSILDYLDLRAIRYYHEFQSPNFLGGGLSVLAFEALVLMLVLVQGLVGKGLAWVEAVLLVFFLHEALHAVRHMILFAIVSAPIVARQVTVALEEFKPALGARWREIAREQAALRSPLVYFPATCALFVGLSLARVLPFPPTLDDLQLSRGAAEFVAAHRERFGRMFNTDDLGGSLIYRFWPGLRIFVDDRNTVFGDPFMMRRYYPVLYARRGWERILDKYGVTAAVLDAQAQCGAVLRASPDWTLVYEDQLNVIFFRTGRPE